MAHSLVQEISRRDVVASTLGSSSSQADGIRMTESITGPTLHYVSARIALLVGPAHRVELLEVIPAGGCAPPIFTTLATYSGED